ncbi:splicing factor, arginine/serine-rich 15 [Lingula anatina]|uniref:Splicing factor, arginine/serine-rich 15 n=1 Tax=Lingula anatina TaxID=7574 RepID=A0A1S3J9G7_LINAN|nr:splicing factor, arginine/serine-rich 15 [Lingula anatina]|eukprot:XP_013406861.1 splicing factor, arginine/serine-rich 15 [Lingula anatina]
MAYRQHQQPNQCPSKGNFQDRFKQMSAQERLIEQKKKELEQKALEDKRKQQEDALKKLQGKQKKEESNPVGNRGKHFGKMFGRRPGFQKRDRKEEPEKTKQASNSNIFSNDGSFLEQFQKLSGMKVKKKKMDEDVNVSDVSVTHYQQEQQQQEKQTPQNDQKQTAVVQSPVPVNMPAHIPSPLMSTHQQQPRPQITVQSIGRIGPAADPQPAGPGLPSPPPPATIHVGTIPVPPPVTSQSVQQPVYPQQQEHTANQRHVNFPDLGHPPPQTVEIPNQPRLGAPPLALHLGQHQGPPPKPVVPTSHIPSHGGIAVPGGQPPAPHLPPPSGLMNPHVPTPPHVGEVSARSLPPPGMAVSSGQVLGLPVGPPPPPSTSVFSQVSIPSSLATSVPPGFSTSAPGMMTSFPPGAATSAPLGFTNSAPPGFMTSGPPPLHMAAPQPLIAGQNTWQFTPKTEHPLTQQQPHMKTEVFEYGHERKNHSVESQNVFNYNHGQLPSEGFSNQGGGMMKNLGQPLSNSQAYSGEYGPPTGQGMPSEYGQPQLPVMQEPQQHIPPEQVYDPTSPTEGTESSPDEKQQKKLPLIGKKVTPTSISSMLFQMKKASTTNKPNSNVANVFETSTVEKQKDTVSPPENPQLRNFIDNFAKYVADGGPVVEEVAFKNNRENPAFAFLYEENSPAHIYYKQKVESLKAGKDSKKVQGTDVGDGEPDRKKKRKSRWGPQEEESSIPPPGVASLPDPQGAAPFPGGNIGAPGVATALSLGGTVTISHHCLRPPVPFNPALLAKQMTGGEHMNADQIKQLQQQKELQLMYDMINARQKAMEAAAVSGIQGSNYSKAKQQYEYDSDEEVDEEGTWEHKKRKQEMQATKDWAEKLTEMSRGKHHIGDFLPPEELEKFMETFNALKEGREPDLSDYKDFKLNCENVGFKMLQKMGWKEGEGLGSESQGITAPVNKGNTSLDGRGLGMERPANLAKDDDEFEAYRKRMMLAYRFRPNPLNNPRRPYY